MAAAVVRGHQTPEVTAEAAGQVLEQQVRAAWGAEVAQVILLLALAALSLPFLSGATPDLLVAAVEALTAAVAAACLARGAYQTVAMAAAAAVLVTVLVATASRQFGSIFEDIT